jgi:hypothetical protein
MPLPIGLPGSCDLEFGGCGNVGSDFTNSVTPEARWEAEMTARFWKEHPSYYYAFIFTQDPGPPVLKRNIDCETHNCFRRPEPPVFRAAPPLLTDAARACEMATWFDGAPAVPANWDTPPHGEAGNREFHGNPYHEYTSQGNARGNAAGNLAGHVGGVGNCLAQIYK